ncbi:MAG: hypothetical protein R3B91_11975 [Planctomycetaceae bacterium]
MSNLSIFLTILLAWRILNIASTNGVKSGIGGLKEATTPSLGFALEVIHALSGGNDLCPFHCLAIETYCHNHATSLEARHDVQTQVV